MNIANPGARCGRDEKRHWPEQFSEFKSPWRELGSNETPTQGPCRRARKNEFVARSGSHHFRVATANVRTLCDKGKSTAVTGSGASSGRAALLEIEMARCGLDLVGIQEGRTQTNQIIEGAEYTMVVAGADPKGNYGTQAVGETDVEGKGYRHPGVHPQATRYVASLRDEWRRVDVRGRSCAAPWKTS